MGVDNCLIELNASETPIMDGSSRVFVEAIDSVGVEEQEADREPIVIKENLSYVDPVRQTEMMLIPADDYR